MATQMQIDWFKAAEQQRHNVATEGQARGELRENVRHNRAVEDWNFGSLAENQRHNYQMERYQQMGVIPSIMQAQTRKEELTETTRHNKQTENLGIGNLNLGYNTLSETTRHNIAQEGIGQANVALGWGNVALGYSNLDEQKRHNIAGESISRDQTFIQQQRANYEFMNAQTRAGELELAQDKFDYQQMKELGDRIEHINDYFFHLLGGRLRR